MHPIFSILNPTVIFENSMSSLIEYKRDNGF